MAHDAGEQRCLDRIAVFGVDRAIVGGRFDRRPFRRPERTDGRLLVKDLGDVAAFLEKRDAEIGVLNHHRAPAAVDASRQHQWFIITHAC